MASKMLDLPQQFGPTIAVMPGSKSNVVLFKNDLKPTISSRLKYMRYLLFCFISG